MKKFAYAVMALLLITLTFVSCGQSDMRYVKEKGVLVIGITEYEPMHVKTEDGWMGFDAELAKEVASRLELEVQFEIIDWEDKVDLLKSKEIDCVWNGYTINSDDDVTFSAPYAKCDQILVCNSANKDKYTSLDSLSGVSVAVERGSASEKLVKTSDANIKSFTTQKECLLQVGEGNIEACIVDRTIFNTLVHYDLVCSAVLKSDEFGIGFRKGSDMAPKFNAIISDLINDGTLSSLAKKYEIELIKE